MREAEASRIYPPFIFLLGVVLLAGTEDSAYVRVSGWFS